jgi:predicted transposase YbfD/YdcC
VVPIEADAAAYPHAAQLISVAREVTHKASGNIGQGCRYFATSLRSQEAGPERLSHQIRGYWGVENIVHWRRDVLCREDKCRLRNPNAACILALLRTALITLVRRSGYDSLKIAQEIFAHNPNKAIRLLSSRPFT